ncbi:RNA-binding protein 28-like [Cryptosporidium felis]|nr:RNA-binding protein 28-like [Cryptosporidium felis]
MEDTNIQESDTNERKTIFLRNVPFEMSESSLKDLIESRFGETVYVKKVISKLTQLPKGVAFVKFKSSESVERVLLGEKEADEYYKDNVLKFRKRNRSNSQITTFLLPQELGIQFNGRRMFAYLALNKSEIGIIEKNKKNYKLTNKVSNDMELFKKGLILPGMSEAKGVSSHDLKLREVAWNEVKNKMNNPNYVVNRFRICIRNIPTNVNSAELRSKINLEIANFDDNTTLELVNNIVLEFEKNEYSGNEDISRSKRIITTLKSAISSMHRCRLLIKKLVNKVNIIRESSSKDSKSKGFAFINISSSALTSKLVEVLNNNPCIFTPEKRPIVEFAIDDKRALYIQKKRNKLISKKFEQRNADAKRKLDINSNKKLGRGKRQRIKKKLCKGRI